VKARFLEDDDEDVLDDVVRVAPARETSEARSFGAYRR